MYTLTAQDIHGVAIRVKDGTKQGYTEVVPTNTTTIDLSVPGPKTRRGRVKDGTTPTLDTGCNVGVFSDFRIRKLTPLECWRLQAASDETFYKAQAVNSDSRLYQQAGNGLTETVVYEIAKRLR